MTDVSRPTAHSVRSALLPRFPISNPGSSYRPTRRRLHDPSPLPKEGRPFGVIALIEREQHDICHWDYSLATSSSALK